MCIIVVKPAGEEWPSWKVLENCWNRNPDGAGLMYNNGENVVIEKGFMDWPSFRQEIKTMKRRCTPTTTVVLHFRIKTHGEVSRECCHPFPLDGKLDILRQTECVAARGVAHNGILSGRNTNAKKSDTMDYIINVLYPLSQCAENMLDDKYAIHLVSETIDVCRLAILEPSGRCKLFGTWQNDAGIYYSNTTYNTPKTTYYYPSTGVSDAHGAAAKSWEAWGQSYGVPTTTRRGGMEETSYEAEIAEAYGFGATDDDIWDEDYNNRAQETADFFLQCPCTKCTACPDYYDCINEKHWACGCEEEVDDYLILAHDIDMGDSTAPAKAPSTTKALPSASKTENKGKKGGK